MEIDITRLFHDTDAFDFSASVAERGNNAGPETWRNAKAEAAANPLLTTAEELDNARDYFGEFGAWDDDTRAAWTADDVNALLIQFISGNIREIESLCTSADTGEIDWQAAERMASEGRIAGDVYPGDDGKIYFCMSH